MLLVMCVVVVLGLSVLVAAVVIIVADVVVVVNHNIVDGELKSCVVCLVVDGARVVVDANLGVVDVIALPVVQNAVISAKC